MPKLTIVIIMVDICQEVNDLAISPANPCVLASASADNTIRLWCLDNAERTEPCVAVFAGEGHVDTVLSVASVSLLAFCKW